MWFLAKNPIAVILESSWNRLTEVLLKNLPHGYCSGNSCHFCWFNSPVDGYIPISSPGWWLDGAGHQNNFHAGHWSRCVCFFSKNPWKNHVDSFDFTWIFEVFQHEKLDQSTILRSPTRITPPISLLRGDPVPGTSSPEPTLGKLSGSWNQNGCPKMWIFTRKLSFVAIQNMETLEMYWFPTIFPLNHIIFGYPNKPLFFLSKSH